MAVKIRRRKKTSTKIKTKSRFPSNKGATSAGELQTIPSNSSANTNTNTNTYNNNDYIAYRGNNYYITIPFIDKIALCGNPPNLDEEEKRLLNRCLYLDVMSKEEGNYPECPLSLMTPKRSDKGWIKSYKNHYKVTPPGTKEFMTVFFEPYKQEGGQRFMRMEFNPRKMGRDNVQYLIDWYNSVIIHSKFRDIVSVPECISYMDIAIDIVGIHISDLILNKNKGKANEWHSGAGLIESYYLNAKKGKNSSVIIYDKAQEELESFKAEDDAAFTYGTGVPVTRIEVSVETTLAVTELHELQNKFLKIKILRPVEELISGFTHCMPEGRHNLDLYFDSVRFRGEKDANRRLPNHLKAKYPTVFRHGTENIFEDYNDREQWKMFWSAGLIASGLLG